MTTPKDRDPLITESTVEAFERVRRERRAPASDDAVSVGALNGLIAMLRGARVVWHAAEEAVREEPARTQLAEEAVTLARQIDALSSAVRSLGGSPPEADEGEQDALPFGSRELGYATDDEAVLAGIASDRERLRQARNTTAAGAPLPDVRVLIESLRI
ncbi:MAG TPA: hypothetical protein VML75_06755 [Kofleriaceae bacterium]|nr:hypothetical protein [Kofleriaceae bacterium]